MKRSTKHKLLGGTQTALAFTLAANLLFNVGSWVYDADEIEKQRLASEEKGGITLYKYNAPSKDSDIDKLLSVGKVGGALLSAPLALLFGGLAVRRFDRADAAKRREENPIYEVKHDPDEDNYSRYLYDLASGSGREKTYPDHFAKKYASEQAGAPSDNEPS